MELGLLLQILGILILFGGVYFKFNKKDSENNTVQNKQAEKAKPKREITYGPIQIYYGSQSGTATKLAGILEEEAASHFFDPQVYGVDKFQEQQEMKKPKLAIFLMATHGEGEPTDNSIQFFKWIKDADRDYKELDNMEYVVFGLGNTQYEHYNKMGRDCDKLLKKIGAKPVYKYGEGDDNSTLEDDFNDWKEELWNELKKNIEPKPYVEGQEINENDKIQQQQNEKQQLQQEPVNLLTAKPQAGVQYDFQTEKFLQGSIGIVKDIREIRQNLDDGSTLHMELDLSQSGIQYKTAQNLGIFVKNDDNMVKDLADFLNLDLNSIAQNPQNAKKQMFPAPLKIVDVLTYFVDFQGQIMKKTLKDLAKLSTNEDTKQKLELMASAKGKVQFKEEIENNKATIYGLLKKYQIKPTFEQLLNLTPRLSPRVFTISSSNLMYPNVVHVTDSLLVDDLPNGEKKTGVCSQYFQKIYDDFKAGVKNIQVRVDFRESSFKLPQDQTPVIMVGPGTGIAPFIAFAQEKQFLLEKGINISPGQFTLYFGCRHENGDYIFKNELKQYQEKNIINRLYTAFSRDTGKKVYVQDLILQNQEDTHDILFNRGGTLFICGSMSMGKSVMAAIQTIIQNKQQKTEQESQNIVKQLEENKKIIKELW